MQIYRYIKYREINNVQMSTYENIICFANIYINKKKRIETENGIGYMINNNLVELCCNII